MNWTRTLAGLCLCLVVGGLANLGLGPSPDAVVPVPAPEPEWQEVAMPVPDMIGSQVTWLALAPWGAPPKPPEPEPAPPPPPPVPVGIVGTGRAVQAIFNVHEAGQVRLGVGAAIPGGGRVLAIKGMSVAWVDGAGQRQERRMFVDPLPQR